MSATGLSSHTDIASINPCTGQLLQSFEPHSEQEIQRRLALSVIASQQFRRTSFSSRTTTMLRAAEILESEKNAFARTMTLEMGKPYRAAVQEVEKCAKSCRFYAENAARFLADEQVTTGLIQTRVCYQPLGVVWRLCRGTFLSGRCFDLLLPP
jgi:succinate-semialdehyde dehydrogenase/glutarate-semialdehyde dehydrogenase